MVDRSTDLQFSRTHVLPLRGSGSLHLSLIVINIFHIVKPHTTAPTSKEERLRLTKSEQTRKTYKATKTTMASSKGGVATSTAAAARASDMEKMSVEQLKGIKEQTDLEVNLLQDSLNNIKTATGRLEVAATSLKDLSLRPQGKKMLVPLTASLYVPGTLDDADRVLVDIGTGYFVEKTMNEGKDYCERKINLLKCNFDQLIEVATKKKTVADEAGAILQAKLRQLAPTA